MKVEGNNCSDSPLFCNCFWIIMFLLNLFEIQSALDNSAFTALYFFLASSPGFAVILPHFAKCPFPQKAVSLVNWTIVILQSPRG